MTRALTRRTTLGLAAALLAPVRLTAQARDIGWEDLIPAGVPYGEIVGEGFMDEERDVWRPDFDANARRFNTDLAGTEVRLPGYVVPLDTSAEGTSNFLLVPYVGACIHVPPPPPNQLVHVTTTRPWRGGDLWTAIWASGRLSVETHTSELAEAGYRITDGDVEVYEW